MLCKMMSEKCGKEMYFVARLLVGFMFMLHGAQKFGLFGLEGQIVSFGWIPLWLGYVSALVELVGGALILLGLFTRPAALLGAINMVFAYLIVHSSQGWNPLLNKGELAVMYFAVFLIFIIYGAGKYSLEKALFKKEYL